ncbi:MAG: peptide deformylase [Bacilli bacterium]
MKYKIIKDTNPKIRKKSVEVSLPLSKEDQDTLDFMLDYLKKSQDEEYAAKRNIRPGVGLAAPQLGILKRMFVVYFYNADEKLYEYQLVNPKIVSNSVKKCALEAGEGCLSVEKEHQGLVHRYEKIVLKAYDALAKKDVTLTLEKYPAVVFQHEYDHLDGILFYDRIDKNKPFEKLNNEDIISF